MCVHCDHAANKHSPQNFSSTLKANANAFLAGQAVVGPSSGNKCSLHTISVNGSCCLEVDSSSSRLRDKSAENAKPHQIPWLKRVCLAELESLLCPDTKIQHIRAIATNYIDSEEVLVRSGWIFVCFESSFLHIEDGSQWWPVEIRQ